MTATLTPARRRALEAAAAGKLWHDAAAYRPFRSDAVSVARLTVLLLKQEGLLVLTEQPQPDQPYDRWDPTDAGRAALGGVR